MKPCFSIDDIFPKDVIVDRIESDIAVLELPDGNYANIPLSALSFEVREGDCLLQYSKTCFAQNPTATALRRAELAALTHALLEE